MATLRVYNVTELLALKPPEWAVEGILPAGGFLALYGVSGDGKSFVALDLALCVATGRAWHGHRVRKGYVVYVSAEGGGGIGKRVGAWLAHHEVPVDDHGTVLAHFVVNTISVHPDSADLAEVLQGTMLRRDYQEELVSALGEDEEPPQLFLVVDTLARCFQGDENQQEDMGAFVRALDEIRDLYDATVLVIHHTNVNGERERGNTAFRAACDAMAKVTKSGMDLTVSCTKQKDDEEFKDIELTLTPVEAWNSCVLRTTEEQSLLQTERIRTHIQNNPDESITDIAKNLEIPRYLVYKVWKTVK